MRTIALAAAFALCVCLSAPLPGAASPSINAVLDASYSLHNLGGLALSPDGARVAFIDTVRNIGSATDPTPHSALEILPIGGGTPVRLTAGDGTAFADEGSPVWSPDGTHVAFLSDARSKGQLQVYVAAADGSGVQSVSKLTGDIQGLSWSPNGKLLSFLYIHNAPGRAGPLAPGARQVGVISSTIYEQRLTILDPSNGSMRMISPSDVYVYEYSWAPDGHALALTYAHGDGDNNWWIAHLGTIDAHSGALTSIYAPKLQIAQPRWSPDGSSIAFIEGLMSDEGSTGGDIYTISPKGTAKRDITPNFNGSAAGIAWVGHTHTLFVTYHRSGSMRLAKIDVGADRFTPVSSNTDSILGGAKLADDGTHVAYVMQSVMHAPEVYAGTLGHVQPLTSVNQDAARFWSGAKSIEWTNDGFHVQGWLIAPKNVQAGKRYPMVVVVHGGPAAENLPSFPTRQEAALLSQGYFVFLPNPRGSFGQGERFTQANVKDFGYGDLRDITSGVTAATKVAPIDSKRVGIYGWSYGGYMTMWAITQTHRFKAAVAGAGVSDWLSYYGENGIDQWMIPYFGASVYDDPAVYARSAPITFIKNVRTPTLVVVGERDLECPAPQSFEYWHALRTLGVTSTLVVYPNEGHAVGKPADQKDIARRLVGWFNTYL